MGLEIPLPRLFTRVRKDFRCSSPTLGSMAALTTSQRMHSTATPTSTQFAKLTTARTFLKSLRPELSRASQSSWSRMRTARSWSCPRWSRMGKTAIAMTASRGSRERAIFTWSTPIGFAFQSTCLHIYHD
jgi:hypothetical protein